MAAGPDWPKRCPILLDVMGDLAGVQRVTARGLAGHWLVSDCVALSCLPGLNHNRLSCWSSTVRINKSTLIELF